MSTPRSVSPQTDPDPDPEINTNRIEYEDTLRLVIRLTAVYFNNQWSDDGDLRSGFPFLLLGRREQDVV
jgi:hypothetical protein